MASKKCPNGHFYDPSVYGDQCPICPKNSGASSPETTIGGPAPDSTWVPSNPTTGPTSSNASWSAPGGVDPVGPTNYGSDPVGSTKKTPPGRTVIRHAGKSDGTTALRKLVGFLVTYNRDPNGKSYNIYEGRNYIGRDESCDISITDDDQISSRHLSILYRNVNDKFMFRDEQSSNGTFINAELIDSGELQNYDIIRIGQTIFIFIAIPKI